ncbi:MAG TPA: YceI family protein [Chitinophagaceae bacterium]|nr:YceI family protein [Chitinophagaceae bacterium]
MKKQITAIFITTLFTLSASAQTYITRNGRITFFSKAPVENIEANNNQVTSILDTKKGEFAFIALTKSFKFKKALMEEHFNENYMESNTFPKANFKGTITDLSKVNFSNDGTYPVTVRGDLAIHGVTKNIEVPATITISQGKISAASKFTVKVKDYNIKIPTTVVNNIAETITITVDCKYDPLKKG